MDSKSSTSQGSCTEEYLNNEALEYALQLGLKIQPGDEVMITRGDKTPTDHGDTRVGAPAGGGDAEGGEDVLGNPVSVGL